MDLPHDPNTCPHCGGPWRQGRLTLGGLLGRLHEELLGDRRSLLRTVGGLLRQPGRVVATFLDGGPQHYYSPVKFFLVVGALALLLPGRAPLLDRAWADGLARSGLVEAASAAGWVEDWNVLLYLPLLLMLGLATRYFFRQRGFTLAEHLAIACYGWAQLLLLGSLVVLVIDLGLRRNGQPVPWLGASLLLVPTVYWHWFVWNVFGGRQFGDALRTLAVLPGALLAYGALAVLAIAALRPLFGA